MENILEIFRRGTLLIKSLKYRMRIHNDEK